MLEFRILGPTEVSNEDQRPLGGPKQRAVLAVLLLEAGRVVSTDRLIDLLWGEEPPTTAATSLQNFISQLRKVLGAETLATDPRATNCRSLGTSSTWSAFGASSRPQERGRPRNGRPS